ncbi:MAG: carbon-nitrogen hydrolase family protein [Parvularculaceae bacterium]|nr:carbon-nitrogen hydrolase family protein [Parvularculaceae bacterium]
MTAFVAACVQLRSGLDRRKNVAAATALIEEAAAQGACFVSTPEMTNVLDKSAERLFSHLDGEETAFEIGTFADLARRLNIFLHIGSMAMRTGERRAANRAFLFKPDGTLAARYDKIHRFDVDLPNGESWRESNVYDAGADALIVRTPLAAFGFTICYDLRFPNLYRTLARAGADVLCVPAAFTKQTGEAHWRTLLTARAIENGAFVIAAAQGGVHEDGRATFGHSLIIGPWGEIVAEADGAEPGVIFGEIDPARSAEARARIPNLALENAIRVRTVS